MLLTAVLQVGLLTIWLYALVIKTKSVSISASGITRSQRLAAKFRSEGLSGGRKYRSASGVQGQRQFSSSLWWSESDDHRKNVHREITVRASFEL